MMQKIISTGQSMLCVQVLCVQMQGTPPARSPESQTTQAHLRES
jgi:hypothetical protein